MKTSDGNTAKQLLSELESLRRENARLREEGKNALGVAEALKESEALLQAAFEKAAVGMDQVDLEGRFIRVNQRFCDLLGYEREELLKMSIPQVTHPEDLGTSLKFLQSLQAGEIDDYRLEKRYQKKDGSIVWADLAVSLVRDAQGRPLYHIGVIQDITARKQAEEALQESEDRFRAIFEKAPLGIAHRDLDGKFLLVNQRLCDLLGYTPLEMSHLTVWDITHPDDLPAGRILWKRILRGELEIPGRQKRYLKKDGSVLWVHATVSLVRDGSGNPKYVISVVEDITEHKGAQEALQKEEERFKILVERMPVGICLINPDGRWSYVNPAFVSLFGYDLKDVPTGRDWFQKAFPDEEYRKQVIFLWVTDMKAYECGLAHRRIFTVRGKDGVARAVNFITVPLQTGEYLTLCEDITERARAEEERLKGERLQAAVRTAGAASHEINQPLQVIMARAELALMAKDMQGPLRTDLQEILECTQRIAGITQKLNHITRFRTMEYIEGTHILDLEKSSGNQN